MKTYFFILLTATILLFTACEKKKDDPTVSIKITSPIANQVFNLGDTVKLVANITTTGTINTYRVIFKKVGGGQVKYNYKTINSKSVDIQSFWVNDFAAGAEMQVDVVAELQPGSGDAHTETVYFKCKY